MTFRAATVILNYHSGRLDKSLIADRLRSLAAEVRVRCEFNVVRTPKQIAAAARRAAGSDSQIVIAGGGDGTINAVASQLAGTQKRLGILPLGTFNYFARELGVPMDLDRAFRTCFEGETRSVAAGEVNGYIFLNNASIGLYPFILSAREQTYRRWGRYRIGAYWSVLKTLLRAPSNLQLTLTAGGRRQTIRTPLVFIARNSYQLQQFSVPDPGCVAADGFSVYILYPMNKLRLLTLAFRTFARRLEPFVDFDTFCATTLQVESRRIGRTIALDGERLKMTAPLQFRVREDALQIAVPATRDQENAA